MFFQIESTETWQVPRPLDRRGRGHGRTSDLPVHHATGDVGCPLLLTSDLHGNAPMILERFADELDDVRDWTLLACGDMSGAGVMGSDGDPAPLFDWALDVFGRVLFVLGNHDVPSDVLAGMRNHDGSRCHLDGEMQEIEGLGGVAGVSGIVSRKAKISRQPPELYTEVLASVLARRPRWLVTHEAPARESIFGPGPNSSEGAVLLAEWVDEAATPRHVFGHRGPREAWFADDGKTSSVDLDHRVLLIEPQ